MGLLPDIWKANRVEEPLVLQREAKLLVGNPEPPEPPKQKKYITRVTIEWENRSLTDHVIDLVEKQVRIRDYWKGFFTMEYMVNQTECWKRVHYPIANVHRIIEEDIEVTDTV